MEIKEKQERYKELLLIYNGMDSFNSSEEEIKEVEEELKFLYDELKWK